jgi:large subunit ribosomal protein L15
MELNELFDIVGAKSKKKRVGRGIGSGKGKTSGRGMKGQKAREGNSMKGFEGGQQPIEQRLPKRGFNSLNKTEFNVVNLNVINFYITQGVISEDAEITKDLLKSLGLVKKTNINVKILSKGEYSGKNTFKLDSYSQAAREKIQKAGGKVE